MVVTFVLPEFAAAIQALVGVTCRASFEQVQGLAERRRMACGFVVIETRHVHQQVNMVRHDAKSPQVVVTAIQAADFIHDDVGDFRLAQPEHEMGLRAPLKHISLESKRRLAYHEAGHAVAVRLFLPHHRIARITIVRQGAAFGHVSHYPARESYQGLRTKEQHLAHLCVSVAGKAAEIEFCGLENQTLGVIGDFAKIQSMLINMAAAGMLGPLGGAMTYSFDLMTGKFTGLTSEQAKAIEEAYQTILNDTRKALRDNAHIVEALVALLLEKDELLADDVRAFFDQYALYTPDPTVIRDGEEISLLPPKPGQALPSGAQT